MNNKRLITFLLFFIVAATANVLHAELLHDQQVCDVCLHIHANDMADIASAAPQTVTLSQSAFTAIQWRSVFKAVKLSSGTLIRGPPKLS